jgi:hypothetical protein
MITSARSPRTSTAERLFRRRRDRAMGRGMGGPAWLRRDSLLVEEDVNHDVSTPVLDCRRGV